VPSLPAPQSTTHNFPQYHHHSHRYPTSAPLAAHLIGEGRGQVEDQSGEETQSTDREQEAAEVLIRHGEEGGGGVEGVMDCSY